MSASNWRCTETALRPEEHPAEKEWFGWGTWRSSKCDFKDKSLLIRSDPDMRLESRTRWQKFWSFRSRQRVRLTRRRCTSTTTVRSRSCLTEKRDWVHLSLEILLYTWVSWDMSTSHGDDRAQQTIIVDTWEETDKGYCKILFLLVLMRSS